MADKLVIVDPEGGERTLELTRDEYALGRDPACEVHLDGPKASRRHARLVRRDGRYLVEDLDSANGVFQGSRRLTAGEWLEPGVEFEVGGFYIRLAATRAATPFSLIGLLPPCEGVLVDLADGEHEVGRVPESPIVVNDTSVSRRHAILQVKGSALVVTDLGSSNGTFVNGERLVEPRRVAAGDIVRFGNIDFRVDFDANLLPARRRTGLVIGVALVVALLLVVASLFVVTRRTRLPGQRTTSTTYEAELATLLDRARVAEKREAWTDAAAAYGQVLERDPIDKVARAGRALAETNQHHFDLLKGAQADVVAHAPEAALDKLAGIPREAFYGAKAGQLTDEARRVLAVQRADAVRHTCASDDLAACRDAAQRLLALTPTSQLGLAASLYAEHARGPREKPEVPSKTAALLAGRYKDPVLLDAVLHYTVGDVEGASRRLRGVRRAARLTSALTKVAQAQGLVLRQVAARRPADAILTLLNRVIGLDAAIVPGAYPNGVREDLLRMKLDLLMQLGQGAVARNDQTAALGYFEDALVVAPDDDRVRSALAQLATRAENVFRTIPEGAPRRESCVKISQVIAIAPHGSDIRRRAEQRRRSCR